MTVHESDISEPLGAGAVAHRKGPIEAGIEALASALGKTIGFMADKGILFAVFAVIWLAFGVALIWSPTSLDAAWNAVGDLPLILQAMLWVLFLPVMAALWIWETTWPLALRLVLVIGLGAWNLFVFLPRGWLGKS